jgi:hypothetical protein
MRIETVSDLLELLEDMDPAAPLRLATQPAWPFEYTVSDVVEVCGTVWLSEGGQVGYLAGAVAAELGWRE